MSEKRQVSIKNLTLSVRYFLLGLAVLSLFFCALFFILPYCRAILPSLQNPSSITINRKSLFKIVWFTLSESLLSSLIALVVGFIAAYYVSHKRFFFRKFLLSLSSIPVCLPPLVVALGYISSFGISGYYNDFLKYIFGLKESPMTFLYSFWGLVMVQGFYNFPLVMTNVADSWSTIDRNQSESALLLGASRIRIFFDITLRQLLPAIVSGCIPVFIYTFFSFMLVLLFGTTGGSTLEVAVYHAARSTLNFNNAAILALFESLIALIILVLYNIVEESSSKQKEIRLSLEKSNLNHFKKSEIPFFVLFILIIVVFFIMPLFSVFFSSFTSRAGGKVSFTVSNWIKIFTSKTFYSSLCSTLTTAGCTCLISTLSAFCYALFLRKKDPYGKNLFFKLIPVFPMAVSSVVLGCGLTQLFPRGNFFFLVLCQSSMYWPFAFRTIYPVLIKIPGKVLEISVLLGENRINSIFEVFIPYSKNGILSALGFTFAMSCGDASLPLVLAIPGYQNLALYTYRLAGSYRFNQSSAAGIILAILCMSFFALAQKNKGKNHGIS